MRVVGCLLFVSFQSIQVSQTEVESSLLTYTLYSHLLSLSSLSLSCLSLSHTPIIVYIYASQQLRTVQFSTCVARSSCNTITFIPSADHSLIHSHSTNHSLIPQAHAIIPLHIAELIIAAMVGLLFDKFKLRLNYCDLILNSII